jgi:hypothetical protein
MVDKNGDGVVDFSEFMMMFGFESEAVGGHPLHASKPLYQDERPKVFVKPEKWLLPSGDKVSPGLRVARSTAVQRRTASSNSKVGPIGSKIMAAICAKARADAHNRGKSDHLNLLHKTASQLKPTEQRVMQQVLDHLRRVVVASDSSSSSIDSQHTSQNCIGIGPLKKLLRLELNLTLPAYMWKELSESAYSIDDKDSGRSTDARRVNFKLLLSDASGVFLAERSQKEANARATSGFSSTYSGTMGHSPNKKQPFFHHSTLKLTASAKQQQRDPILRKLLKDEKSRPDSRGGAARSSTSSSSSSSRAMVVEQKGNTNQKADNQASADWTAESWRSSANHQDSRRASTNSAISVSSLRESFSDLHCTQRLGRNRKGEGKPGTDYSRKGNTKFVFGAAGAMVADSPLPRTPVARARHSLSGATANSSMPSLNLPPPEYRPKPMLPKQEIGMSDRRLIEREDEERNRSVNVNGRTLDRKTARSMLAASLRRSVS